MVQINSPNPNPSIPFSLNVDGCETVTSPVNLYGLFAVFVMQVHGFNFKRNFRMVEKMGAVHTEKSNGGNKRSILKYLKRITKEYQIGATKYQK